MAIRVEVFDSFEAAGETWEEFQRGASAYVFQTREWLESWFERVGRRRPIRPCFVSVFDGEEVPVVFFPFQISTGKSVRELNWLGDELIDYGAPVVAAGGSQVDFSAVWSAVRPCLPPVDLVRLSRIPEKIGGVGNPMLDLDCRRYHSSAHFVDLEGDWEAFYGRHASPKTRSTDRRKHRRLSDMGELRVHATDGSDEGLLSAITARMIEQKVDRYRELRAPNIMDKEGIKDFFARPTEGLRSSGTLHVSALELDGKAIATHWGMKYDDRFYYFMPSYADGPWMRFSPGRLLLFELFKWCIEKGVTVFDFTIGDEPYKKDWCDREMHLYHYFEARTGKGRAAATLLRARAALLSNRLVLTVARKARRLFNRS
jgi:CelD/BcsL family acetyltransferase involved in cellulose biosynthesis